VIVLPLSFVAVNQPVEGRIIDAVLAVQSALIGAPDSLQPALSFSRLVI
jgi:hypothetical protein